MTPIVLASSPLVGPGAMEPVAERLRRGGREVRIPDVPPDLTAFAMSVAEVTSPDAAVVGFSAAGPRLFQVAEREPPAALVFLDARLPVDGQPADADPEFAAFLDALPQPDGLLPRWSQWWPDVIAGWLPIPDERAAFDEGCPRLQRSMFSTPIPAPGYDGQCGFIRLSAGYARDAAEARRRGWPVTEIDGAHHLWPLTAPDAVADAVVDMVARCAP